MIYIYIWLCYNCTSVSVYFILTLPCYLSCYLSCYMSCCLCCYLSCCLCCIQWDIVMDWGFISCNRSGSSQFRKRFYYYYVTYPIIAAINICLRFSWASNRIAYFAQMQPSHLVLLVEFGEVFRRALWNFYRVEWEMIVQHDRLAGSHVGKDDDADEKVIKSRVSASNINSSTGDVWAHTAQNSVVGNNIVLFARCFVGSW